MTLSLLGAESTPSTASSRIFSEFSKLDRTKDPSFLSRVSASLLQSQRGLSESQLADDIERFKALTPFDQQSNLWYMLGRCEIDGLLALMKRDISLLNQIGEYEAKIIKKAIKSEQFDEGMWSFLTTLDAERERVRMEDPDKVAEITAYELTRALK